MPQPCSLVLIKPSHYDDEGYVLQRFRSAISSNSLAVVHGLSLYCKERCVLGDDIEIAITAMDEDNTRIRPKKIARQLVPPQIPQRPAVNAATREPDPFLSAMRGGVCIQAFLSWEKTRKRFRCTRLFGHRIDRRS